MVLATWHEAEIAFTKVREMKALRTLWCIGSTTQINLHFLYGQYMPKLDPPDSDTVNWSCSSVQCTAASTLIFFCRNREQKNKQKTSVSRRINSSPHLPITVIVTGRCSSFMKMACQSFLRRPTQTMQTHKYALLWSFHCRTILRELIAEYPINLTHTWITDYINQATFTQVCLDQYESEWWIIL